MLIEDELKMVLENGVISDQKALTIEIGLVKKSRQKHLVAFVGGILVFHSTYKSTADTLLVRAGMEYLKKNLFSAVFEAVSILGSEAVELPQYEKRKKVVREWSEHVASRARGMALQRQQQELKRLTRETATYKPIIKDHRRRVDLLRRSLDAIAELRRMKKPLSQKAVAQIVYGRPEIYEFESASAQYWRELKEGFGRSPSVTFTSMVELNKTWEELTIREKNDLNCPEIGLNKRRRKTSAKKVRSV